MALVRIAYEDYQMAMKVNPESSNQGICTAIRNRMGVPDCMRIGLVNEEGLDVVINGQLQAGRYKLELAPTEEDQFALELGQKTALIREDKSVSAISLRSANQTTTSQFSALSLRSPQTPKEEEEEVEVILSDNAASSTYSTASSSSDVDQSTTTTTTTTTTTITSTTTTTITKTLVLATHAPTPAVPDEDTDNTFNNNNHINNDMISTPGPRVELGPPTGHAEEYPDFWAELGPAEQAAERRRAAGVALIRAAKAHAFEIEEGEDDEGEEESEGESDMAVDSEDGEEGVQMEGGYGGKEDEGEVEFEAGEGDSEEENEGDCESGEDEDERESEEEDAHEIIIALDQGAVNLN